MAARDSSGHWGNVVLEKNLMMKIPCQTPFEKISNA
jgi:hypothetical protein